MRKQFNTIMCIILLCLLGSCHKCHDPSNPTCDNYNPCYEQSEVNAKFIIQEANFTELNWIPYTSDTCRPYDITFKALTNGAQYEWHIGTRTYTTQQVDLSFGGVADGTIPITLIIQKTPNLKCFPKDNGRDTLTRNLYIRRNRCYVYGQYHGAFTDDPSHPFSITIERKIPMPDHYQWALSSCGFDTLVVQTYGWSIPHGTLSGNYPCGEIDMRYAARRELFFSVNPPDTIHDTSNFKDYPLCVAVLDSTLNIITIKIQEITPFTHNGIYDSTHYANKIFQGVRM